MLFSAYILILNIFHQFSQFLSCYILVMTSISLSNFSPGIVMRCIFNFLISLKLLTYLASLYLSLLYFRWFPYICVLVNHLQSALLPIECYIFTSRSPVWCFSDLPVLFTQCLFLSFQVFLFYQWKHNYLTVAYRLSLYWPPQSSCLQRLLTLLHGDRFVIFSFELIFSHNVFICVCVCVP